MKHSPIAVLAVLLLTGVTRADYALPAPKERLVLLVKADGLDIDRSYQTLLIRGLKRRFPIDRFWMQDRIWGDGICVRVPDSDPRSAAARVAKVGAAVGGRDSAPVLIELVRLDEGKDFIVTYMKSFDAEKELPRYFPKRSYYDTVKLPPLVESGAPANAKRFIELLERVTRRSMERLTRPERDE